MGIKLDMQTVDTQTTEFDISSKGCFTARKYWWQIKYKGSLKPLCFTHKRGAMSALCALFTLGHVLHQVLRVCNRENKLPLKLATMSCTFPTEDTLVIAGAWNFLAIHAIYGLCHVTPPTKWATKGPAISVITTAALCIGGINTIRSSRNVNNNIGVTL